MTEEERAEIWAQARRHRAENPYPPLSEEKARELRALFGPIHVRRINHDEEPLQ